MGDLLLRLRFHRFLKMIRARGMRKLLPTRLRPFSVSLSEAAKPRSRRTSKFRLEAAENLEVLRLRFASQNSAQDDTGKSFATCSLSQALRRRGARVLCVF